MTAVEVTDGPLDRRSGSQELRQGEPPEGEVNCVRKGERTRRRILVAARRKFAEVGYERATVRTIAAEADVDKSSVIQHFGSKGALFREAVHWGGPSAELATDDTGADADADDPGKMAENYARGLLDAWATDPHTPMAVLLRAAMTCHEAAELWRVHAAVEFVGPIAATVTAADARLRAALLIAMLTGIAGERHLLGVPDLAAADVEDILRLTVPVLLGLIAPGGESEAA
ncbi:TetR family transcriptional regulator [Streptomyces sp. NPDC097640]|uniref:TetR/AcrR family transcriptional regulator n=1 Tax=Streptomyces sp. NPDC097640 TaxID=3157229 RepID=UPI003321C378